MENSQNNCVQTGTASALRNVVDMRMCGWLSNVEMPAFRNNETPNCLYRNARTAFTMDAIDTTQTLDNDMIGNA